MSGWRQLADSIKRGVEVEDERDDKDDSFALGRLNGPLDAGSVIHDWRTGLLSLDPLAPRLGLSRGRWGVLLEDADWLFEHFAPRAARDGWSAADLFGVLPGHDAWGGLADRLRGSRSLVMAADRAAWRRVINHTPETYARGGGAMPRLALLWDTNRG